MARNVNMQRQHFEFIAATLRDLRNDPPFSTDRIAVLNEVTREFANRLRATNANFDTNRFERACGLIFSELTLTCEAVETRNDD